jgi:hypothetical protein
MVQSIVMHMTVAAVSGSYVPTCFPNTSAYSESIIDTYMLGAGSTSAVMYFRCLRLSQPSASAANLYPSWTQNPYVAGEKVSTAYPSYQSLFSSYGPITFTSPSCTTYNSFGTMGSVQNAVPTSVSQSNYNSCGSFTMNYAASNGSTANASARQSGGSVTVNSMPPGPVQFNFGTCYVGSGCNNCPNAPSVFLSQAQIAKLKLVLNVATCI